MQTLVCRLLAVGTGLVTNRHEFVLLIRILRPCASTIEGVDLSRFEVGQTYDAAAPLATYLVVMQCAEPIADEPQSADTPRPGTTVARREERVFQGTSWPGWAVAADWLRRK